MSKTDQLAIKTVNKAQELNAKKNRKPSDDGGRSSGNENRGNAGGKPETIARKIYASVAAIAAGIVARKIVEKVWVKTTGKTPPSDPNEVSVPWAEALGWSVASGVTVGAARLLATRKAAGAWQRVSEQPPVTSSPRDL